MNTAVPPPHDDQVFNLLASSFENSLSDDGGGGGGRYSFGALSPREQTNNNRTSFPSTDITIPDLKQGHEDFSIGDISPIKLEYTYSDRNGHYDHEGWKSSSNHLDVAVSNPFFVIRSARKAFDACKYLLPCLRGEHLCQVNMASHGHIQHYQRPEVSLLRCLSCVLAVSSYQVVLDSLKLSPFVSTDK